MAAIKPKIVSTITDNNDVGRRESDPEPSLIPTHCWIQRGIQFSLKVCPILRATRSQTMEHLAESVPPGRSPGGNLAGAIQP